MPSIVQSFYLRLTEAKLIDYLPVRAAFRFELADCAADSSNFRKSGTDGVPQSLADPCDRCHDLGILIPLGSTSGLRGLAPSPEGTLYQEACRRPANLCTGLQPFCFH
jgi:hypothetical protein